MASIYLKPGVYSQYIRTASTIILGAGARVVAIIGSGPDYFTIVDQAVKRGEGYPYLPDTKDDLGKVATSILRVGNAPGLSNYSYGADYILTEGKIDWSPGGNEPAVDDIYYVSYTYAKSVSDYAPQVFNDILDIEAEYGISKKENTLSLGCRISIENGASPIIVCQVSEETDQAYKDAIDKLKYSISEIDPTSIVALSTSNVVQAYLKEHILFMSAKTQRKERFAVMGMSIGTSKADVIARATALANERIIFPYEEPTRDVVKEDGSYEEVTLDGNFVACAIAGMMTKYDVQEPLTRKTVVGFKSLTISTNVLETELDTLASNGILVLTSRGGIVSIRHGMTTNTSAPEENEISVMQIRDYVIKNIRDILDKIFIAKPASSPVIVANINSTLQSILLKFVESGVIVAFGDITVKQNKTNATQYDVSFSIKPTYPINYIMITWTINPNL